MSFISSGGLCLEGVWPPLPQMMLPSPKGVGAGWVGGRDPPEPSMLGNGARRVDECLLPWVETPFCLCEWKENSQAAKSSELSPDQVLGFHAVTEKISGISPWAAGPRGGWKQGSPHPSQEWRKDRRAERTLGASKASFMQRRPGNKTPGAERGFPDLRLKAGPPGLTRDQRVRMRVSGQGQRETWRDQSQGTGRLQGDREGLGSEELQAPGQTKGDAPRGQRASVGMKKDPQTLPAPSPAAPARLTSTPSI